MDIKRDNASELDAKKEMSWLQNKLVINWVVFLILIGFLILKILPGFTDYGVQKDALLLKIADYNKILHDGVSHWDFSAWVTDEELRKLMPKIGVEFFEKNLKNKSSLSYLDFVKQKTEDVNKIKTSPKIKIRDEKLSKVLPSYQEWVIIEGAMSDLDFINYIENLLKAFWLQTTSEIWVSNLVLVEDKSNPAKVIDSLSSQIFYMPIEFSLKGRKADIVEFLYYIQNVGKVEKVENDDIKFYSDPYTLKKLPNYKNIYESKIMDIDKISIPSYIDTSSIPRGQDQKTTIWFLNFIRNGVESGDEFEISLDARFYVKGLPIYKLEDFILKIVKDYKEMKAKVEKNLADAQNRKAILLNTEILSVISSFKTIKIYLDDLDQTIKRLEAGMKQKTGLEKVYLDAAKVKYDLWNISELLEKNVQNLNKNKK